MTAPGIDIRPVTGSERADWEPLWRGYLDFYKASVPNETYDITWARLQDAKVVEDEPRVGALIRELDEVRQLRRAHTHIEGEAEVTK